MIMEKELVSVIVPVYNVEQYVSRCVESLLYQSYKPIEIILVDDGSTDDSGTVCDKYEKKYENIHVIHKQNEGLGYARNTGLQNIHGEYVVFVDSDDWVSSDFIKNLYRGLKEYSVDYCKSGFCRMLNDGTVVSSTKYADEFFPKNEAAKSLFPRMIGSSPNIHDSIEMSACAVMYRSSVIIENGITFPSERDVISEDIVFNMEYLNVCSGAVVISNIDYMYRVNTTSLSHTYRPDRYEACIKFYSYMTNRLNEYGYEEDAFYRLKRILFVYIRAIIRMEANHTAKNIGKRISSVRCICTDVCTRSDILDYPVRKLQFKQRVFVYMLKYKMAIGLYLAAKIGVL